ncbi:mechanosensitive ion channel family protein [[Eubacterium] cellulosolvens]
MNFGKIFRILEKEIIWLSPRIVILALVSIGLFLLSRFGYITNEQYTTFSKIWLVAYILFGAALFNRYIIPSIRKLLFKLGTHYVTETKDRVKLRRATDFYSRLFSYTIYIIAVLASINIFFNLQVVWSALGTTFFLIITFFIGLLTSSVLGNLIAYEAIRQTNIVSIHDMIEKRDEFFGEVIGIGAFSTNVKTTKNEIISVPNLDLVSNVFTNYSKKIPLIIYIPISLGYDLKKDFAKKLLIEAAKKTKGILKEPKPFVLILELGNYAITYEINAFIDQPLDLVTIRSDLMENIIDIFRKNKVAIVSPQYATLKITRGRK